MSPPNVPTPVEIATLPAQQATVGAVTTATIEPVQPDQTVAAPAASSAAKMVETEPGPQE